MLYEWINIIVLGALLGAAGQGARGIVGWKKISDEAQQLQTHPSKIFRPSRMVVSIVVGAVAGMLAAVSLIDDPVAYQKNLSPDQFKQFVLVLVGIGYAGTDFIEGFVRNRYAGASGDSEDTSHKSGVISQKSGVMPQTTPKQGAQEG